MRVMNRNSRSALVRDKMQRAALPGERPARLSGGPGGGMSVVCSERINPPEVQYECARPDGETTYFCRPVGRATSLGSTR
jgi:hypothetical protein